MAPMATSTFTQPGGRARVAWENAVPADTSTMAPIAVVQAISSREAQAAIATSTAPRHASRNRIESSGRPGRLARRTASIRLTAERPGPRPTTAPAGPGTARARRRPAPRRSATGSEDGTRPFPGAEKDRSASLEHVDHGPQGPLRHAFGRVGVRRQFDGDRHRLGRRPLQLADHQRARMCRRAPVHQATAVTGRVRAGAPGQAPIGSGLLEDVARPLVGVLTGRLRPAAARRDVECRREWEQHPPRPPLQRERRGRSDVERHRVVDAAPDRHERDDRIDRAPASRPIRRIPRGRAVRRDERAPVCGRGHEPR